MKDKKPNGKYANKKPIARFFHRYTGFITVAIIISIIAVAWYSYESDQVFFESWSCEAILSMRLDVLDAKEYLRYQEIKDQCMNANFMP